MTRSGWPRPSDRAGVRPPGAVAGGRLLRLGRRPPGAEGARVPLQAAHAGLADRLRARPRSRRPGGAGLVRGRAGAQPHRGRVPDAAEGPVRVRPGLVPALSLIHISEPTRLLSISYAV